MKNVVKDDVNLDILLVRSIYELFNNSTYWFHGTSEIPVIQQTLSSRLGHRYAGMI